MSDPLFILAPPRSFTSVVCGMIGQHPDLYGLPEVNLFAGDTLADLSRWHRMRPRLRHGLLRAVAELGLGGQDEQDIDTAAAWLDEHADVASGEVYHDLVEWAGPRRLVDKSPIYVIDEFALERIYAAFPDARFLHLTRHPWGTCKSMVGLRDYIQQAGGRPGRFDLDPNQAWLQPHTRVKEFLDSIPSGQWLRLQGEQLLGDPGLYLPQIAQWLGIRTDAEAIEAMKHPETSPYACMGPENAQFGNDPGFMENPALRPYKAKPASLDDPLPEGVSGEFSDALRHYANLFGYQ